MSDTQRTHRDTKTALAMLTRRRRAMAAVLWGEIFITAFAPLFYGLVLFAAIWLSGLSAHFPHIIQILLAALFWGGATIGFIRAIRRISRGAANDSAIDRAIEQRNAASHRPLGRLRDHLANKSHASLTDDLWARSYQKALSQISALHIKISLPNFSAQDPYALRIAIMLFFIIGLIMAGPLASQRIKSGAMPFSNPITGNAEHAARLTLWITPPAYTGLGAITPPAGQSHADTEPLTIPAGSIVKATLEGNFIAALLPFPPFIPQLVMGEKTLPFTRTPDGKNWQIEAEIPPSSAIEIRQLFLTRYALPISYKKDTPPTIALTDGKEPQALPGGQLLLPLTVKDDYGVRTLHLHITLNSSLKDPPLGADYDEERPIYSGASEEAKIEPSFDLAWHPWAGLPVTLTVSVADGKGQSTALPPIEMTLPQRHFAHPTAKELVTLRRRLIWLPRNASDDTLTGAAEDTSAALANILPYPAKYQGDFVTFLSLRSMISRLRYAPTKENIRGIIAQLWDTAIQIEDGKFPQAARNLRTAQQKLQNLLNDPNASDVQIAQAMDELQQALQSYFMELGRELQKRMANGQPVPLLPEEMMKNLDAGQLQSFLEQLKAETQKGGRREQAMEMLSRLDKMMNAMNPAMSARMPPEMQFMQKGVSALQRLIDKQKDLRDQTQHQANIQLNSTPQTYGKIAPPDPTNTMEGLEDFDVPQPQETLKQPPKDKSKTAKEKAPAIHTEQHKVEQDSLRYILGQLMIEADKKLGKIPQNMQNAELAMRDAAAALGKNDPATAVPHQDKAIEELEKAQKQMQQQLEQMMQQMQIIGIGPQQLDPFGRPLGGGEGPSFLQGDKVKIPDESERKRAQDIQRELRERSGDRNRPDYELDYFQRLLKQF